MSVIKDIANSISEHMGGQRMARRAGVLCMIIIVAVVIMAAWGAMRLNYGDSVFSGDYEIVTADDGTAELIKYKGDAHHVEIPSEINGYPVVSIGDEAFRGNRNVLRVTIPDSVTSIGSFAFAECPKLQSVELSGSVSRISDGAFYRCPKLAQLTIPEGVTALDPMTFYDCYALTVTAPHEPQYYTDKPDELTADIAEWVVA